MLTSVFIFATILVPITTALVQLVKTSVSLPKNILPFVALIVGIFIGLVSFPFTDFGITLRLWSGAIAGLASVGLFELGNQRSGTTK